MPLQPIGTLYQRALSHELCGLHLALPHPFTGQRFLQFSASGCVQGLMLFWVWVAVELRSRSLAPIGALNLIEW